MTIYLSTGSYLNNTMNKVKIYFLQIGHTSEDYVCLCIESEFLYKVALSV